jgi:hypothetical protein
VKDNRRMMRVAKMADTSYTLDWIEFETKKRAEMYVCVREFFK